MPWLWEPISACCERATKKKRATNHPSSHVALPVPGMPCYFAVINYSCNPPIEPGLLGWSPRPRSTGDPIICLSLCAHGFLPDPDSSSNNGITSGWGHRENNHFPLELTAMGNNFSVTIALAVRWSVVKFSSAAADEVTWPLWHVACRLAVVVFVGDSWKWVRARRSMVAVGRWKLFSWRLLV